VKNFHLDLVRVTEAAAIAAAEWVGRGEKEKADEAATKAMQDRLNRIDFRSVIAIGEGKKDKSFGLYEGEVYGLNVVEEEKTYSIAVDPIEGTTPTAKGGYEAMSVLALAGKDCFYKTEVHYMKKIAVGPKVASKVNVTLKNPIAANVELVANALDKSIKHVDVCVLDRPRHGLLVSELRKLGCRIKFISDCDVSACIAACEPDSGIDMYVGIGGSPEAVITAAAMKCMGGYLECQLWDKAGEAGYHPTPDEKEHLLSIDDLAKGDVMFVATGITDGKLLKGVRFKSRGPVTQSIAMRSPSQTVRRIETRHGN